MYSNSKSEYNLSMLTNVSKFYKSVLNVLKLHFFRPISLSMCIVRAQSQTIQKRKLYFLSELISWHYIFFYVVRTIPFSLRVKFFKCKKYLGIFSTEFPTKKVELWSNQLFNPQFQWRILRKSRYHVLVTWTI